MASNKTTNRPSTTSSKKTTGKTITVTLPSIKKPDFSRFKVQSVKSKYTIAVVLVVLVSLFSGVLGGWLETRDNSQAFVNTSLSGQKQIVTSNEQLIAAIAKKLSPSVVSVNVSINTSGSATGSSTGSSTTNGLGGGFGNLFGLTQPQTQVEQAAGTGIIISSSGIVMTNRHVVPQGTTKVSITLSDGVTLKNVSVIGRTNPTDSLDIAFLKINNAQGQTLIPASFGDSSQMQVGDSVVAIGNALGQFQNTVTSGIISGYGRSVTASSAGGSSVFGSQTTGSSENLEDLFQTDAAINEGNSGGPLVNMNGQVIGVNTALAGNAQNIGFAIPINNVKGLMNQVLRTGKLQIPFLGVRYIPLTPSVASEYNLSVKSGAFIAPSNSASSPSVVPGTPAAKAGLEPNDIITAVNGKRVNKRNSLTSLIEQYSPGTTVNLTVLRSGKTIHLSATLAVEPTN